MEDLNALVPLNIVQAALIDQGQVLHQNVTHATSSVQGFSSLMLRVQVFLRCRDGSTREVSLVAKVLPPGENASDVQQNTIRRFRREEAFFREAEPILRKRCPHLPVVKCLAVHLNLLILEDLGQQKYGLLPDTMQQVGTILLKRDHMAITMQRLAEYNAASIDINWTEKIPLLKSDNFFELNPSPHSFYTMCMEAFTATAIILAEFYPGSDQASNWLLGPLSFAKLVDFSKPSQNSLNVLAHGDFWINNMMFKQQPLDVCFIDFQLCRYVHPTRDILHVMYTCLDRKFRIQHEVEMLEIYVKTFNKAAGEKRLNLDTFILEYNKWRLAGSLLALVLRSLNLMSDILPNSDTEMMTQNDLESIFKGKHYTSMPLRYRSCDTFRQGMQEVLDEYLTIVKSEGIC